MNLAPPVILQFPTPRQGWYAVSVFLLALTFSFIDRQILSLMVAPVRASLGLSDTQISLLHGAAFLIFYSVLGIPLGRWADRHNRQRMIILGIIVWSLATAACGFAQSFWQLFGTRIIVGAGEAVLAPAAYSMISDYFPPARRGRAVSVYTLGIMGGTALALILGGQAIALTASGSVALPILGKMEPWQAAFIVVGLPGLLIAALMLTVREPRRMETAREGSAEGGTVAFIKARLGVILQINFGWAFGGGVAGFGMAAWAPEMMRRVHHWPIEQTAITIGLITLTLGFSGVLAAGQIGDRLTARGYANGRIYVAMAGMAGVLVCAPVVGLAPSGGVAVAAIGAFNFAIGLTIPLANPVLHAMTPNEHRGQMTGVHFFIQNIIGFGFGPLLIALVTDRVFDDDLAIGKSIALIVTCAAVIGLLLLNAARKTYPAQIFATTTGDRT